MAVSTNAQEPSPLPPAVSGGELARYVLSGARDPRSFLESLQRTYGDAVLVGKSRWRSAILFHPDHAQYVLKDNHKNFVKQNYGYRKSRQLFGNGILTSEGEFWLRQRRLTQPAFRKRCIEGFATVMAKHADHAVHRFLSESNHQPVQLTKHMHWITMRIITESLFGSTRLDNRIETLEEDFAILVREITDRIYARRFLPLGVPTRQNRRVKAAYERLDDTVTSIVAARLKDTATHTDLLSLYLAASVDASDQGMTEGQLRDEMVTLFLAGEETIATALCWTLFLLSQHPEIESAIVEEIDRVVGDELPNASHVRQFDLLRRAFMESMRLYPPGWIIARQCVDEDAVGGFRIPAGCEVTVGLERIHRHPEFWPDPDTFNPDRFLPEAMEGQHSWAYMPFSSGPHQCIGNHFAMMEGQLVLATLLRRLRFRLPEGHMVERDAGLTMGPRNGLPMYVEPR